MMNCINRLKGISSKVLLRPPTLAKSIEAKYINEPGLYAARRAVFAMSIVQIISLLVAFINYQMCATEEECNACIFNASFVAGSALIYSLIITSLCLFPGSIFIPLLQTAAAVITPFVYWLTVTTLFSDVLNSPAPSALSIRSFGTTAMSLLFDFAICTLLQKWLATKLIIIISGFVILAIYVYQSVPAALFQVAQAFIIVYLVHSKTHALFSATKAINDLTIDKEETLRLMDWGCIGVLGIDQEKNIVYTNKSFDSLFGYTSPVKSLRVFIGETMDKIYNLRKHVHQEEGFDPSPASGARLNSISLETIINSALLPELHFGQDTTIVISEGSQHRHLKNYSFTLNHSAYETPRLIDLCVQQTKFNEEEMIMLVFQDVTHYRGAVVNGHEDEPVRLMFQDPEDVTSAESANNMLMTTGSAEAKSAMEGTVALLNQLVKEEAKIARNGSHPIQGALNSAKIAIHHLEGLLDFTSNQASKVGGTLEVTQFNAKDIVGEIYSLFDEQARKKGIRLSTNITDKTPIPIQGDRRKIKQTLFHLVNKAFSSTVHGSIVLRVEATEKHTITFEVEHSRSANVKTASGNLSVDVTIAQALAEQIGSGGISIECNRHLESCTLSFNIRRDSEEEDGFSDGSPLPPIVGKRKGDELLRGVTSAMEIDDGWNSEVGWANASMRTGFGV